MSRRMIWGVMIGEQFYAYSKKREIALIFARDYLKSNPKDKVKVCRLNREEVPDRNFRDYRLVPVNGWDDYYIPEIFAESFVFDFELNDDKDKNEIAEVYYQIINSLYNCSNEGYRKVLKKMLKELREIEDVIYIPSISHLYDRYWRYEMYKNQTNFM